jgi:hypothetical protein
MSKIIRNGIIGGLVMGIFLFVGGAILARLFYGPQMAPHGKFDQSQMNAFYFIWTKLAIGIFFGLLFSFFCERLSFANKITGPAKGIKYSVIFWFVITLWDLSHPIVYNHPFDYQNQLFWLLYVLCGYIGLGLAFGFLYRKKETSS